MLIWFIFTCAIIFVESANILSVLPSTSKSHFIYPNALLLELAASGHQVTVMSPFPLDDPPANYKSIDISSMKKEFESRVSSLFSEKSMRMDQITKMKVLYQNTLTMTNFTLQHDEMKKLLLSGEKFDLIILDLFLTDALLGLSTVFDCPIIALSANGPHTWVNDVLGSPRPASYVPHMYSEFTDKMNLGRRLENEIYYFIEWILMRIYHLPEQERLFNEVFVNSTKSFDEVRKSAVAIALVNSHFSISFPKPFLPNTIEVAGMQINEAILKPLPDDIREFIESSEHGVIYFSLGGNIRTSQMDPEKLRDITKALMGLRQNVIWKYDGENLDIDPKKIMVRKWLPQYEILGHNNTKIFITHAGLLSCTEAVYFAKNVIAVPIFGDQPQNAKKMARSNYGIHLDYFNFTGESLSWAVNEILSNPIYRDSMENASKVFRDRPLSALETGKFWVEYLLRHKNMTHYIRSSNSMLNFVELHNLDVYVIITIIMFLFIFVPCYYVMLAAKNVYRKKNRSNDEKKEN